MVTKRKQHSSQRAVKQGPAATVSQPNGIGAFTPYNIPRQEADSLRRLAARSREGADLRAWAMRYA